MNRISVFAWLVAGGIALGTSVTATGHGGATGIVADRMMGMMMLAEQVKALTPLLEGGGQVEQATIVEAAGMISMHAGSAMTGLFPEGSLDAPSVARPEIWQRWEKFSDYSSRLAELGDELAMAAEPARLGLEPTAAEVVEQPPTEWEAMSFEGLMGLPSEEQASSDTIDSLIASSAPSGDIAAQPREPKQIVAEITATCSSCHAAFRR
ncbi:cytochrome c [Devosia neptuniae]|jgi:cytochrome c556|uniref:cytochrome c n=1 Tax=Devosia TaxID=46913 RepID=UPI002F3503D9